MSAQEVKMSEQVKRYHAHQIPESGRAGLWVHAGDFNQKMNQAKEREEALHAEAEALKQRLTTERGNAAYWKEQYQVLRNDYQRTISEKVGLRTELEAARGLLCELIGAVRTINHGPQHKIMVKGDDQPSYWQRQEWVVYLLRMCNEAEAALTATPAPEVQAEQGERQEAVAWSLRLPDGRTTLEKAYPKWAEGEGDGYAIQPLYTSPPPAQDVSGLVEALEQADEYLSHNKLNEIGSGSILHCVMQEALAAHRQAQQSASN